MNRVEVGQHMVMDPQVCHGKLTFKGTRVPVQTVLAYLGKGRSVDNILEEWPQLTREAVAEAIGAAEGAKGFDLDRLYRAAEEAKQGRGRPFEEVVNELLAAHRSGHGG